MTNEGEEPLLPASGRSTDGEDALKPATNVRNDSQGSKASAPDDTVDTERTRSDRPPRAVGPISGYILGRASFIIIGICGLLILVFQDTGRRDSAITFIKEDLKAPLDAIEPFQAPGTFLNVLLDCERPGQVNCHAGFPEFLLRIPVAAWETIDFILGSGVVPAIVIGVPVLVSFGLLALAIRNDWRQGKPPVLLLNPFTYLWFILLIGALVWGFQLLMLVLLFIVRQTILACFILAPISLYAYHAWQSIDGWRKFTEWLDGILTGGRAVAKAASPRPRGEADAG